METLSLLRRQLPFAKGSRRTRQALVSLPSAEGRWRPAIPREPDDGGFSRVAREMLQKRGANLWISARRGRSSALADASRSDRKSPGNCHCEERSDAAIRSPCGFQGLQIIVKKHLQI